MDRFLISSRCECEATLSAALDAHHHVISGWATRRGERENAPAHSIHADLDRGIRESGAATRAERFDVGWLCPFCGRNTLRTFHVGALRPAA